MPPAVVCRPPPAQPSALDYPRQPFAWNNRRRCSRRLRQKCGPILLHPTLRPADLAGMIETAFSSRRGGLEPSTAGLEIPNLPAVTTAKIKSYKLVALPVVPTVVPIL